MTRLETFLMPQHGYAGEILSVDLSDGVVKKLPTAPYAERFVGGHGIAARLYWELVPPDAKAFGPENALICASGPVAGFPGFAGNRWKVCAKSPLGKPESFSHCNLGERWGSFLKFAGYDALAVRGKADRPVYLYIDNGSVEIRDAAYLWGLNTFDTIDTLQSELGGNVSVMTIGPAGENLIPFSNIMTELNASGSGGMGAVMGSKNLKAIAVTGKKRPVAAHPETVRELVKTIRDKRPRMGMPSMWAVPGLTSDHACYGCGIGCSRQWYRDENGRRYKSLCQASNMYENMVIKYTGKNSGARLLATRLCDGYGLDTTVMQSMIEFLEGCFEEGLISEKETGLPLSRVGSPEFIEELTRITTLEEGFGAVLARGIIPAAAEIGTRAEGMLHRFVATSGSEKKDYDPRLFITTGIFYATEPRRFIHALHEVCSLVMMWLGVDTKNKPGEMFPADRLRRVAADVWGSELAADFSTYEGKALAAKTVQDRVYAKECLVLCDLRWTMTQAARSLGTGDNVRESQVYAAITGNDVDQAELYRIGERVFNLNRAIILREGRQGRQGDMLMDYFYTEPLRKGELFYDADCLAPGRDGEVFSRLGKVVDRDAFEKMKDEYYGLRDWDVASGLPKKEKLSALGLEDVASDLEKRGLVK